MKAEDVFSICNNFFDLLLGDAQVLGQFPGHVFRTEFGPPWLKLELTGRRPDAERTFCGDGSVAHDVALVGDEDDGRLALRVLAEGDESRLGRVERLGVGDRVEHEVGVHVRHDGRRPGLHLRLGALRCEETCVRRYGCATMNRNHP